MVFWVGILVSATFAWLAIKLGFYETWAMLFNIIISIYLAVFLGPVIIDIVPGAGDTAYSTALAMISTAIGAFLILHCISYTLITGQFSVSFPKIFNTLGTGILGFLAGFLIWSFVILLICTTPISQQPIMKELGFGSQSQANVSNIRWWCDLVHKAVLSQNNKITGEEAISGLLEEGTEKKTPDKTGEATKPNEPARADVEDI